MLLCCARACVCAYASACLHFRVCVRACVFVCARARAPRVYFQCTPGCAETSELRALQGVLDVFKPWFESTEAKKVRV